MGAVKSKLKSSGGASIIIALLFFLICSTVGVSVLAAAKANAGRLKVQKENEQAYLTVRSSAQLMRSLLGDAQTPFAVRTETFTDGVSDGNAVYTKNYSDLDLSFANRINDEVFKLLAYPATPAVPFELTFSAEDMPDVKADVLVEKTSTGYKLTADFSIDGSVEYNYFMTLAMTGTLIKSETNDGGTVDGEGHTVTVATTEYTLSWSNGILKNR